MKLSAVEIAMRAANAVTRSKGGWLADIDAEGRAEVAAEFVRQHPDAPAEAVFIHVSKAGVPWAEIAATKRVAVEVFRATYLIVQRLADADAPQSTAPAGDIPRIESGFAHLAGVGDRIWDEDLA